MYQRECDVLTHGIRVAGAHVNPTVGSGRHLGAASGVLAQSEACVLSKHEVLGSKPRYSKDGAALPPPIWCSW